MKDRKEYQKQYQKTHCTINISKETRKILQKEKQSGETYNQEIRRMIIESKGGKK